VGTKSEVQASAQEPYYWYYGTLAMFQMGARAGEVERGLETHVD